jgi:predicted nucleic acid-binding protein
LIVYVESNFPLELARQQEQHADAEQILLSAEARQIELRFPQISIAEPFAALDRFANERNRFLADLERQLSDLNRSQPHQPLVANLQPLVFTLIRLRRDETNLLESSVERMLSCGTAIPLTLPQFRDARSLSQSYGLSPQDAMVLSCVLSDLRGMPQPTSESCFISRNSRDFAVAKKTLVAMNCHYIPTFADGLKFIRARLARSS